MRVYVAKYPLSDSLILSLKAKHMLIYLLESVLSIFAELCACL